MINSIKTISFEEVKELLKNLKSGDCCKISLRKFGGSVQYPYILNVYSKEWFMAKENTIVLILDKKLMYVRIPRTIPRGYPTPSRKRTSFEDWGKWDSLFLKVLYEDQICLIHAGWLEKI